MLAEAEDIDVAEYDHLVEFFLEQRYVEYFIDVLLIPFCKKLKRL